MKLIQYFFNFLLLIFSTTTVIAMNQSQPQVFMQINQINNETDERILLCDKNLQFFLNSQETCNLGIPLPLNNFPDKKFFENTDTHLFLTSSKKTYPLNAQWLVRNNENALCQIDLLEEKLSPLGDKEPRYGQKVVELTHPDQINKYIKLTKTIFREQNAIPILNTKSITILIDIFLRKEKNILMVEFDINSQLLH